MFKLLTVVAAFVAERGGSRAWGSVIMVHGLSYPEAWDLPRPGTKLLSPAWQVNSSPLFLLRET